MSFATLLENLKVIQPLVVLVVWACALLLVDLFIPKARKGWTALLAAVGLLLALGLTIAQNGQLNGAFNGMVMVDGFAVFLNALFLGSGLVAIALAYDYLKRRGIERGEFRLDFGADRATVAPLIMRGAGHHQFVTLAEGGHRRDGFAAEGSLTAFRPDAVEDADLGGDRQILAQMAHTLIGQQEHGAFGWQRQAPTQAIEQ